MNRWMMVFLVAGLSWFVIAASGADSNRGKDSVLLKGGSRGDVTFPHHLHQDVLVDCSSCHDLFPKRAGVIADLKIKGELKKKQVMKKKCVSCHKAMKKAKKKTGPTKCSACHVK